MAAIRLKSFAIVVPDRKEETFIDELEDLCRRYAQGKDYYFQFEVDG